MKFGYGKDAEVTSCIYVEESGRSGGEDLTQSMKSVTGAMSLLMVLLRIEIVGGVGPA